MKNFTYLLLGFFFSINLAFSQTTINNSLASPGDSSMCSGDTIGIYYNITGTFFPGNIFSAELSDQAGSFASPVVIGSVTSTSNGIIVANIPGATAPGSGYRIRIVSSSPVFTGSVSSYSLLIDDISILEPPVSEVVPTGGTAMFSVLAEGEGLVYQWKNGTTILSNGGNISGCGTPNLTIGPVSAPDASCQYKIVLGSTCVSYDSSSNVCLTVSASPPCNASFNFVNTSGSSFNFYSTSTNGYYHFWDFGDGAVSNGGPVFSTVSHSYPAAGTYFACLTISDSLGACYDTVCATVNVPTGPPSTMFTLQNLFVDDSTGNFCTVPADLSFNLMGIHTGVSYPDTINFQVYYGDGTFGNFQHVSFGPTFYTSFFHVYTAPGTYSVQIIGTATNGDSDTLTSYNSVVISDSCGNISGKVYNDANGNCMFDGGDSPVAWASVKIMNGTSIVAWNMTDANGDYVFVVPSGPTYTVQLNLSYMIYSWASVCPTTGAYAVTVPSINNDFGLACYAGFDLKAYSWGWGFVPGQPGYLNPSCYNVRCQPVSGTLSITLDPLLTYVSSVIPPASVSGSTITWNFTNLTNNGTAAGWPSFMSGIQVTTATSATIGDSVCVDVTANPVSGDAVPVNNTYHRCWPVLSSYDPNAKEVFPKGEGTEGFIPQDDQTAMDYTVHFQNTGTFTAFNIFILDTLDANLDVNSFILTGSSHSVITDILPGNILKFSFNGINLPDSGTDMQASNGFVSYEIKQLPDLAVGTQIKNTAHIFFDFNEPVATNTTLNTIGGAATSVKETNLLQGTIQISPNPSGGSGWIQLNLVEPGNFRLNLTDITGRNLQSNDLGVLPSGKNQVYLETTLPSGIYFCNLISETTFLQTKFILVK